MPKNYYRLTLYNTQFFTELLTYKYPILPAVGDMIEVVNQRTMFIIQSRSFLPHYESGMIDVVLYGVFENGENMGQHTFDKIRAEVKDEKAKLTAIDWTTDNRTFPEKLNL